MTVRVLAQGAEAASAAVALSSSGEALPSMQPVAAAAPRTAPVCRKRLRSIFIVRTPCWESGECSVPRNLDASTS